MLFDFGHAGVDFFFVLSGFIIHYAHAADLGRPDRLSRYAWRRFTRIYPTYWVAFAAILPVYFLIPGIGGGYTRDPLIILESFVLWPQSHLPILNVAWTLSHEILFYCIFGLAIANKHLGGGVFALWLSAIIAQLVVNAPFPQSFLAHPHNMQFFLGLGAGVFLRRHRISAPWAIIAVGAALFFGTGLIEVYTSINIGRWGWLSYGLGSMLALIGAVEAERSGLLTPPAVLVLLGEASYSIYLVHTSVLSAAARVLRGMGLSQVLTGIPAFMLLALLALGAGLAFHLLVERPLLRLLGKSKNPGRPLAKPSP